MGGVVGVLFLFSFLKKALRHKILLEPRGSIVSLTANGRSCLSSGASQRSLAKSCELCQRNPRVGALEGGRRCLLWLEMKKTVFKF